MAYTSVVTIAWVVVGTGAGTGEVGFSGELFDELDMGTGAVVTGTPGVDTGGGTHCVHTVEVLVMNTVETVDVVSTDVVLPLVTVLVIEHVVSVV